MLMVISTLLEHSMKMEAHSLPLDGPLVLVMIFTGYLMLVLEQLIRQKIWMLLATLE
jgi:hypothetical protein